MYRKWINVDLSACKNEVGDSTSTAQTVREFFFSRNRSILNTAESFGIHNV